MNIRNLVRSFSLFLKQRTDKWVVPAYITELIDDDKYDEAKEELEKQLVLWPNDPEITFHLTLIAFLERD